MAGFNKLVPEIVQSSIWNRPSDIRIVWITILALKDQDGYVRGDAQTLSRMANVSVEATEQALAEFQEPDPSSHTPDDDGRRLAKSHGGWIVLNNEKYRGRDMQEEHREYMRKWRENRHVKKCESQVNHSSVSVSVSDLEGGVGGKSDDQFERCWTLFGRYGVKSKSLSYWRQLTQDQRASVEAAIPEYLKAVTAGRKKMQFEGWINPKEQRWTTDWKSAADVEKQSQVKHKILAPAPKPNAPNPGAERDMAMMAAVDYLWAVRDDKAKLAKRTLDVTQRGAKYGKNRAGETVIEMAQSVIASRLESENMTVQRRETAEEKKQ